MKPFGRSFCLVIAGYFLAANFSPAADTNPPPRLTVELRDGSRVVGESADKYFTFRSALMGEMKLSVKDIRAVECVSSNSAKLFTANGDSLTVSIVDSQLSVKTSFGKVELPVKLIRSVRVSTAGKMGQLPSGLVALWSGEGDAKDSVNGHDAIESSEVTYSPAKIGMGFNFVGPTDTISVPASTVLDVGNEQGFTLACWIAPASVADQEPLIEWRGDGSGINQGVHLWISVNFAGVGGEGCIYANIVDTDGGVHIFASPMGIVHPATLQHVSLTYDKISGVGKIYYNGFLVASSNLGNFTQKTDTALLFGQRVDFGDIHYQGIMDEISLYARALSAAEIQAICAEQNGGEPLPPPSAHAASMMPFNGINRTFRPGELP